ncbi:2-amino-4-hydroxy-6-hydroxymethyldihydropteridine diphosphokinase [Aquibacillus koreensis]|uniref:2-amino-4-hydroxy-6-hydroxymethyldihydropteridine diphosphokinase n=2 Tax=Aquibacillus koreensis TaxID=279446 RepID=A0A9X3WRG0_9BACI|nr:2-amino-4-hydroxy-6-hydroxymethyldihydropteridine diphosphokinase [Aquibacillus koreensis]MCT2535303.1 2-amino-4-hydroxy-6-hydroxymethyldihydropteridine diphosphokinase [Aquibacillus koreensis]MDC3422356.1 2-amino-4-hydroxy-6-hydroxymethyldihydropteridine diphosphokinase [Aquibacillus koreensis]
MNTAYIALGSNINTRDSYLDQAIKLLDENKEIHVQQHSFIYETEPVGFTDQENFLNMVIEIHTNLTPLLLLEYCQFIERKLGREREIRWGPRTIDLDILLFNQENIKTEQLIVPHPRMHERAFVLVPLKDVNPSVNIPSINKSVTTVLGEVSSQEKKGVCKWDPSIGEKE